MILPSKELLSEVLGVTQVTDLKIRDNKLFYTSYNNPSISNWKSINIYELQHRMKEWASMYGYDLYSYRFNQEVSYAYLDIEMNGFYRIDEKWGFSGTLLEEFEAQTEHEAVTQACEWVRSKR
jgi:hypothetical protein